MHIIYANMVHDPAEQHHHQKISRRSLSIVSIDRAAQRIEVEEVMVPI